MRITPIEGKVFGAEVRDVHLGRLTEDEWNELHAAFLEHGFLVLPDQHLTDEENVAFGSRFGELEFGAMPMSNVPRIKGGGWGENVMDIDSQWMRTNVGNETWHTDSTYKPLASKCAMLSAAVVPAEGGQTELADLRAGYDALDADTIARIAGLSAYHSTQFSQANDLGDFPEDDHEGAFRTVYHGEAYLRPLIKVHPETGRKNLFVGRHAFGIPGLERQESRALLSELLAFVVSDESRVYSHSWTPGDTMIWDNRRILHRARPYDYNTPRALVGTRIAGEPDTELAYYPEDPEAEAGRAALQVELELLKSETADLRYGGTTATKAG